MKRWMVSLPPIFTLTVLCSLLFGGGVASAHARRAAQPMLYCTAGSQVNVFHDVDPVPIYDSNNNNISLGTVTIQADGCGDVQGVADFYANASFTIILYDSNGNIGETSPDFYNIRDGATLPIPTGGNDYQAFVSVSDSANANTASTPFTNGYFWPGNPAAPPPDTTSGGM